MQRFAEIAGIPQEAATRMPRVTVHGNSGLFVEQHEGLLTYREDVIVFLTALGRLTIRGRNLEIAKYGKESALVKGVILALEYPDKEG